MIKTLHEDWGPGDGSGESWDMPGPMSDLAEALEISRPRAARYPSSELGYDISLAEVDRIERYHVSYHGETWLPGQGTGSELDMYVVGQLVDGRWFSVVAYNDYTGWGCQDGAEVRVGETEAEVVLFGLDEAARKVLDY